MLAAVVVLAAGCGGGGDEDAATKACQDSARDQLRSPEGASFHDVKASKKDDNTYRVQGYVDAENGLGLVKRDWFTCTASGDGDGWSGIALVQEGAPGR